MNTPSSRVYNFIKVIQTESYQYSDLVVNFVKEIYVEFDFDAAQMGWMKARSWLG